MLPVARVGGRLRGRAARRPSRAGRALGADQSAGASTRAREPPPPIWTGSLGAGLSLNSGNTDTSSYNLTFEAVRDPKKKWIFRTDGLYLRSEENDVDTADKSTLNVREERSLGERLFAYGDIGYLRDRFKDIDYLITPDGGHRLEGGPSRAGEP